MLRVSRNLILQKERPVITQQLIGVSADQGDRITLKAVVEGNPRPTVTWWKNGQSLQSVPSQILLTQNGNEHQLCVIRAEVTLDNYDGTIL